MPEKELNTLMLYTMSQKTNSRPEFFCHILYKPQLIVIKLVTQCLD